jgi:hypothetical protein
MFDFSPENLLFLFWTGHISEITWFTIVVVTAAAGFVMNKRTVPV